MGASDLLYEAGPSNTKGKGSNGTVHIEVDEDCFEDDDDDDIDDYDVTDLPELQNLGQNKLEKFCKTASTSFFEKYGLISHQLNSYNEFIKNGIQNVFDSIGEIVVEPGFDPSKKGDSGEWRYASVKFGKVVLEKPLFWPGEKFSADNGKEYLEVFPRHARLQNMTYSAKIKVNTHVEVYTQKMVQSDKFKTGIEQYLHKDTIWSGERDILVGSLPVMVKSDLCRMSGTDKVDCDFDHGGYFIIKGAEKVIIAQEQLCLKRVSVIDHPEWAVSYRPPVKRRRVYIKLQDPPVDEQRIKKGEKNLTLWFSLSVFPIWVFFFALGVSSDKEVINLIEADTDDERITDIIVAAIHIAEEDCPNFRKGRNAIKFVGEQMKKAKFPPTVSTEDYITSNLFPNITGFKQKARFLGYMVKCLLQAYTGKRKTDNRDDFKNKRLDLAGELIERELRALMMRAQKGMVKSMQRDLYGERELQPIEHYLDASVITSGLSRAFSTGGWIHPYKWGERTSGVVAMLRRANPLQATSDTRKLRQQVSYTGKVGDPRYPHPSHWGRVCFLATPDGENCGLVKNLASMGLVSTAITTKNLIGKLIRCGMKNLVDDTSTSVCDKYKIFLDGDWVGICEDSVDFVSKLRRRRRKNQLPLQVEIKRDEAFKEVRIFADAGRILRPLLVVDNLKKIRDLKAGSSFQWLLDNGIVELIGTEEEEDCHVAWGIKYLLAQTPKQNYTHCELDLSYLLGLSAGIIPFVNHDHAKRSLYQSEKHSQQAMGFSTTNPKIRVDTHTHSLFYPQIPIFRTTLSDCLGNSISENGTLARPEFFNGQSAIVAVNVHLGFNQEDSLVMNRSSLERGMFRSEHIKSYKADVDNKEALGKKIKFEDAVNFGKIQSKIGRVDSLDDDGFPYIGANLQTGDIVIGRNSESGTDQSIKLKHTEKGMVQKVILSANDEGKNFAVVSLRQVRFPCLGDKFSSMHGQKGVLGFLESQENFPFTKQGIVPDIVINPHAFPSRQTPGQLLEAALGKGIALGASQKHATPFSTLSVDAITDQLHRAGFQRWGNERVYNGRTGEMIKSLVFMGPMFYQRLVHMAEDKVKLRNTGPVHPLTRQPVADRKRFGGIKFGEMERDCLIAHGAAANLHERLFTLSDCSEMHICRRCKHVANVIQRPVPNGGKIRGPYCRICESVEDVIRANVPYGAKLLCQELFSMGITLKFDTELC